MGSRRANRSADGAPDGATGGSSSGGGGSGGGGQAAGQQEPEPCCSLCRRTLAALLRNSPPAVQAWAGKVCDACRKELYALIDASHGRPTRQQVAALAQRQADWAGTLEQKQARLGRLAMDAAPGQQQVQPAASAGAGGSSQRPDRLAAASELSSLRPRASVPRPAAKRQAVRLRRCDSEGPPSFVEAIAAAAVEAAAAVAGATPLPPDAVPFVQAFSLLACPEQRGAPLEAHKSAAADRLEAARLEQGGLSCACCSILLRPLAYVPAGTRWINDGARAWCSSCALRGQRGEAPAVKHAGAVLPPKAGCELVALAEGTVVAAVCKLLRRPLPARDLWPDMPALMSGQRRPGTCTGAAVLPLTDKDVQELLEEAPLSAAEREKWATSELKRFNPEPSGNGSRWGSLVAGLLAHFGSRETATADCFVARRVLALPCNDPEASNGHHRGTPIHADPLNAINLAIAVLSAATAQEVTRFMQRQQSAAVRGGRSLSRPAAAAAALEAKVQEAFLASLQGEGPVVAVWLVIAPWAVGLVHEIMRDELGKTGGLAWDGLLSVEEMQTIVALVAQRGGARDGCAGAHLLRQRHGECVFVPAGWPHAVRNVARCIKLAADGVAPAGLPAAVEANQLVRSVFFAKGKQDAGDYGNLCARVWDGLVKYAM